MNKLEELKDLLLGYKMAQDYMRSTVNTPDAIRGLVDYLSVKKAVHKCFNGKW